jgi:hypothetical protein
MTTIEANKDDIEKNIHGDPEYILKLPKEPISFVKILQCKRLSLSPSTFRENFIPRPKDNKVRVPLYKSDIVLTGAGDDWVKITAGKGLVGYYSIIPIAKK